MPTAAHRLRIQIEAALADKISAALTLNQKAVLHGACSGIRAVDEMLTGGLRCGVITELVGSQCSGRTSLALAYAASIIDIGSVCAWVDVADSLCPESAAANGVDLERLLWVRCGSMQKKLSRSAKLGERLTHPEAASQPRHAGGGSPHPRSEGRNMPEAVSALLGTHGGMHDRQVQREKRSIGTPGAANRPLVKSVEHREEQVNSDRLPPRRGDNLAIAPRCAEPQRRLSATLPSTNPIPRERAAASAWNKPGSGVDGNPWQALDQAVRATDLLLQSGGFSAIVLDLGGTPPETAWRIPLATWFRFRAACERTRTSLLLLTQHPCARSSAELVVRLEAGIMEAQSRAMTGIRYRAAVERSRSDERGARVIPIRKLPQSTGPGQWTSEAAWGLTR